MRCCCGVKIDLDSIGRAHCDERQESGPQQQSTNRNAMFGCGKAQVHVCWDCKFVECDSAESPTHTCPTYSLLSPLNTNCASACCNGRRYGNKRVEPASRSMSVIVHLRRSPRRYHPVRTDATQQPGFERRCVGVSNVRGPQVLDNKRGSMDF
jgi:hypothetical protein